MPATYEPAFALRGHLPPRRLYALSRATLQHSRTRSPTRNKPCCVARVLLDAKTWALLPTTYMAIVL